MAETEAPAEDPRGDAAQRTIDAADCFLLPDGRAVECDVIGEHADVRVVDVASEAVGCIVDVAIQEDCTQHAPLREAELFCGR